MTRMVKVMVVLNLVLSLLLCFYSMKNARYIDIQRKQISILKETLEKGNTAIAGLTAVINSSREKITQLRVEKQSLKDELDKTIMAKKQVENELESANNRISSLEGALDSARKNIASLEETRIKLEGTIGEMNKKVGEQEKELVMLRLQLQKVLSELAFLKSKIEAKPEIWELMHEPSSPQKVAQAVLGKVVSLEGLGVVVLSFNGSSFPSTGTSYRVFRSGEEIGSITIGDVYRSVIVCQAKVDVKGEGETLQRGDNLVVK